MPQNPNIIATQSTEGAICIYQIKDNGTFTTNLLKEHKKEGFGISWNNYEKGKLLTCSNDSSIILWDVETFSKKSSFLFHKSGVQDVAWHSKNSALFGSVGEDTKACIWDSRNSSKPEQIFGENHKEGLNCIDFNKINENLIAVGSADATISIWDMRNLKYLQCSLEQHDDEVLNIQWAPNNENLLASGDKDGRIMAWDLSRLGEEISKEDAKDGSPELIFTHMGHKSSIADLAWNKDIDLLIASVDQANILQIWKFDKEILNESRVPISSIKNEDVE